MKTIRFTLVVKQCGAPEIHLAWIDPKRDRSLKRALVENRVMTLHQELHGGKKDFGTVGYLKDRHAQILLFPKSLRRFTGRKIVAIDYALFAKSEGRAEISSVRERPAVSAPPVPEERPPEKEVKRADSLSSGKNTRPATEKQKKSGKVRRFEPPAPSLGRVLGEVRRAMAELAAGKSVPAYERLKRLVASPPLNAVD